MAKNRKKSVVCPNCEYTLQHVDNFCPNCGQENHTHKMPVKHFVFDFLASSFNFDTKIINTLKDLIRKPGLIIYNFNQNKRARYVTPMKFYIFISFFFFLLLFKVVQIDEKSNINFVMPIIDEKLSEEQVTWLKTHPQTSTEGIDSLLVASGIKTKWYSHNMYVNYLKLKSGRVSSVDFLIKILRTFSTLLFLFMPLYAFFIYIFNHKLKIYYAEYLVFSIYLHSVVFLVFSVTLLLVNYFWGWIFWLGFLYLVYYTFSAFKFVYNQKTIFTIFKLLVISTMYGSTLLLGLLVSMLVSLF